MVGLLGDSDAFVDAVDSSPGAKVFPLSLLIPPLLLALQPELPLLPLPLLPTPGGSPSWQGGSRRCSTKAMSGGESLLRPSDHASGTRSFDPCAAGVCVLKFDADVDAEVDCAGDEPASGATLLSALPPVAFDRRRMRVRWFSSKPCDPAESTEESLRALLLEHLFPSAAKTSCWLFEGTGTSSSLKPSAGVLSSLFRSCDRFSFSFCFFFCFCLRFLSSFIACASTSSMRACAAAAAASASTARVGPCPSR